MIATATSDVQAPLLATKLYIPRHQQIVVPRPQLDARLDAGLARPLTLVSAPAGFGKTTLVSAWARSRQFPVAWLTLDERDNDPARFLSYLVAALQQVNPVVGRGVQAALAAPGGAPPAAAAASLINELAAADHDLLLVVDDFHLLDAAAVLEVFNLLVAHQPPQLHLMIVTREDPPLPLARLRAHGALVELRAADLRFAPAESARFLRETMSLPLDAAAIAALDAQIEGWPAGLQLAAISLQNSTNPAELIAGLSGSHRFIASYLAEEVLRQLSPTQRTFLLETAVLSRLNGELCDFVTGRDDSHIILEELLARNAFIIPLDDSHAWCHYHPLFAELLRQELQRSMPERAATLRQRASAWWEAQGAAAEAIDYALAAADYVSAVRLLESHARAVVLQGYAQTVESWLQRLPPAWRSAGPHANLAYGWSLLLRGQPQAIEPYLNNAELAGRDGDTAIEAEAMALRAALVSIGGDAERGCDLARTAMELAPPDDLNVQSITAFALGTACNYAGKDAEAIAAYRAALPLCQATNNQVAAMLIIGNLTMLYIARGQLRAAAALCTATIDDARNAGAQDSPALAAVYGGLGDVLFAQNELAAAEARVSQALALSRSSGHVAAIAYGSVVQSRLLQARGDLDAAGQALALALQLKQRGMPAWVAPQVASQQVALALAHDDLAAAEQVLLETGVAASDPIRHTTAVVHIAHLRLLLRQARYDEAHDLARRILTAVGSADRMGLVLETLLLRAQLNHVQGDAEAACADITQALILAESDGYVRPFADAGEPLRALLSAVRRRLGQQPADVEPSPAFVDRVLAALPAVARPLQNDQDRQAVQPALIEPLTERELEVLRLIAQGLTYDEVALQLIVSVNTVRYHVKGIYGKLGVDKRHAAVEQAKVHGLL